MKCALRKLTPVSLLISTMFLFGCGGQTPSAPTPQVSIRSGTVFVGDSIFGRWDLDAYFPGKGYINAGWFGKRTDEILAVFPSILDGSKVCHGFDSVPGDPAFPFSCQKIAPPATVVLLIGWNDMLQGKSMESAVANINQMLSLAKQAGVKVLVGITYEWDSAHINSWMQPWDACSDLYPYRDVEPSLVSGTQNAASSRGFPVANIESLFRSHCESDYTIDGLHPNASGYQQMAELIAAILAKP